MGRPEKLHVALDVMQIYFGISGGVEVYMKTLAYALISQSKATKVTLLCMPEQEEHLRQLFGRKASYHSFRNKRSKRSIWLKSTPDEDWDPAGVSFSRLREELGVEILHSPVQIFSRNDFTVPSVLNLHDLQHLHFPENFAAEELEARTKLYSQSARQASAVIASSEFVRQDIIERIGVPSSRVFTVTVACNPAVERGLRRFPPKKVKRLYDLPERFAFYPAQFWLHKNHVRLIEALANVRARAPEYDLKLVLTGYRGHSGWPRVEEAIGKRCMREHVYLLDYIPVQHLAAIYRQATFCIVPSLFEASSYPVIEAQTLGCPAMCSNVTSLPELMTDGAGLLFDPLSPEDMANKMLRWLKDPQDRLAHAERGRLRASLHHSLSTYSTAIKTVYGKVRLV